MNELVIDDKMYRLVLTNALTSSQDIVDEGELVDRLAAAAFPMYD